ncbi:MAG: peptide ABC transporter substrate-binding protein [Spirochaetaceae bacterium]|jgi:peptide/nickel transport system substrate-binding protein/oligopeptide transport system substrate-binding protein|nr:peptide ABC transporter substrate-binding protein [Spirochaetaceae bacterium]
MKHNLLTSILLVCLPACALLLPSCMHEIVPVQDAGALPSENTEELPSYAEIRPRSETTKELTTVFYTSDPELDPRLSYLSTEAQLFTGLYEGLFTYDPRTMAPLPSMAESYTVSEDKKTWTFKLQKNAQYSNGDKVRASDFVNAWISLLDPSRDAPYSSLFDVIDGVAAYRDKNNKTKDASKVRISATDDSTLVVGLVHPTSFLPYILCHHSFSPIHPSLLNEKDWFHLAAQGKLIGNGPFYIADYMANTSHDYNDASFVLKKSPYYWDKDNVALETINYRMLEDLDTASMLWNSGFARWLDGNVNYDTLNDTSGIKVNTLFSTHYFFIRSVKKPLQDSRVRQAMTLTLPWQDIRSNYNLPAETLVYPLRGYPEIKGLNTTDIDKAKKLLAEAGYPEGKGIEQIVIRIPQGEVGEKVAGMLADNWKKQLGLTVKIEVTPAANYFNLIKDGNYDVGVTTWIGDFADPYTFLQNWRSDSNLNDAKYNNPEYDAILDRSMQEEGEARWKTLGEAEQILLDSGACLPLSYNYALNIIDTNEIGGWFLNALDIHPFKYLYYKTLRALPGVV